MGRRKKDLTAAPPPTLDLSSKHEMRDLNISVQGQLLEMAWNLCHDPGPIPISDLDQLEIIPEGMAPREYFTLRLHLMRLQIDLEEMEAGFHGEGRSLYNRYPLLLKLSEQTVGRLHEKLHTKYRQFEKRREGRRYADCYDDSHADIPLDAPLELETDGAHQPKLAKDNDKLAIMLGVVTRRREFYALRQEVAEVRKMLALPEKDMRFPRYQAFWRPLLRDACEDFGAAGDVAARLIVHHNGIPPTFEILASLCHYASEGRRHNRFLRAWLIDGSEPSIARHESEVRSHKWAHTDRPKASVSRSALMHFKKHFNPVLHILTAMHVFSAAVEVPDTPEGRSWPADSPADTGTTPARRQGRNGADDQESNGDHAPTFDSTPTPYLGARYRDHPTKPGEIANPYLVPDDRVVAPLSGYPYRPSGFHTESFPELINSPFGQQYAEALRAGTPTGSTPTSGVIRAGLTILDHVMWDRMTRKTIQLAIALQTLFSEKRTYYVPTGAQDVVRRRSPKPLLSPERAVMIRSDLLPARLLIDATSESGSSELDAKPGEQESCTVKVPPLAASLLETLRHYEPREQKPRKRT